MDEDRYASAANWQPPDPYKKLREKALREFRSKPQRGQTMLEIRPASHWIVAPSQQKPRRELYGPMWREGEVCLLFGPKSVGKSLFAVQLAEDLATGSKTLTEISNTSPHVSKGELNGFSPHSSKDELNCQSPRVSKGETFNAIYDSPRVSKGDSFNPLIQRPKPKAPRPRVLLIDFEQTTDQFTERYTYPSPIPGKLPCRTRFHFQRASISEVGEIPACFKGSVHKYLQHSIAEAIYASEARIVIIDSINYLFRGRITATAMTNVLKTLKLYAQMHQVSILATAQSPTGAKPTGAQASLPARKTGAQASLPARYSASQTPLPNRHAHLLQLATLADTAILLAPSTYGPQYRYTKLLATRSQVPQNLAPTSTEVLTYELNSPPARGGVAGLPGRGGGSDPQSEIRNPQSTFTYLGPSNEQDHLRNYAAESEAADRAQESALKRLIRRSATATLVDGILDGSYGRYLRGE